MKNIDLTFGDEKISCRIIKKRGVRRLILSIDKHGRARVSSPYFVTEKEIKHFVENRKEWLFERIKKIKQSDYKFTKLNKKQAHYLVKRLIEKIESEHPECNFNYNKFVIKNLHSRWGSCSVERNLNFSYKLIYVSEELAEYVVAHELCHLLEMNHSAKFWHLVSQIVGNYRQKRRALKVVD